MNPKISVIIPVYNAAEYIKRCIDSILAQNYSNLEIICINDGSTDKSLSVLQNLAQTNSCIKVISQENSGVPRARNIGIENATGEYISFIDADDTFNGAFALKALRKGIEFNNGLYHMCVGVFDEVHEENVPNGDGPILMPHE